MKKKNRHFLIYLLGVLFTLSCSQKDELNTRPFFIQNDAIADSHITQLVFEDNSLTTISETDQQQLIEDYKNIWAHLNHLYATNDVVAGKRYYTEAFFDWLCTDHEISPELLTRKDIHHQLTLTHYSNNGLLAIVKDELLVEYYWNEKQIKKEKIKIGMALQKLDEKWCIDAIYFNHSNLK